MADDSLVVDRKRLIGPIGWNLGIALSSLRCRALVRASPVRNIGVFDFGMNANLLGFVVLLSAGTMLMVGSFPALQAATPDLAVFLNTGLTDMRRSTRIGRLLVVTQVTIAFVLVVAAGASIRSVMELNRVELGFDPGNVLSIRITIPEDQYRKNEELDRLYTSVIDSIESVLGVAHAGSINNLTMTGADRVGLLRVVGQPGADPVEVSLRSLSPHYFDVLSVPLVSGRGLTERDRQGAPLIALVNETFAREWFFGRSPLGATIAVWDDRPRRIVGVIRDFYEVQIERPIKSTAYLPVAQAPTRRRGLAVKVNGDPTPLALALRRAIWVVDPALTIDFVLPMTDLVSNQTWMFKMMTNMLGVFAVVGLTIGAVGIYGVTSYGVARRIGEIGLRMALGASRRDVLAMILSEGLGRTLIGIVLGLPLAIAFISAMATRLAGMRAAGEIVWLGVVLLLLAVTTIACCQPAHRGSQVDPACALRLE